MTEGEYVMEANKRIKSIDILRGFAVALMIIGNNPGNSDRIYTQLRHPAWNGLAVADFGFPIFILTMCMTIPIVMEKKIISKKIWSIVLNVIRKSFMLVLLGIFLNGFPLFNFKTIRILGVLQRLGIVYLIVSLIYLAIRCNLKKKAFIITSMIVIGFLITIGYYFLLKPFGFGLESNLAKSVDIHLLGVHMYNKYFDPEGIITTIGAVATGIFGCLIGYVINLTTKHDYIKPICISLFGLICMIIAFEFNKIFPFNKHLWSSSYILVVVGYTSLGLALLYLICDIYKKERIFTPFRGLGNNPIFVYIVTELIRKSFWQVKVFDERLNLSLNLTAWITTKFVTPWAGVSLDSFYFSLIYLIIWISIANKMYNNNTFIKI